jgi:hypothetical protein
MRTYGLLFFSLLLISAVTLACGTSQPSTRLLQSVTISPASASGQTQFTASGKYNAPPSPVNPLTVNWGACYQNAATTEVTVSSAGLAQCAAGASGTYTVYGWAPSGGDLPCPNYVTACGGGGGNTCQVTGTAQLTCP